MGLSAEHEVGFPVDEEGVAAVLFDEGGDGGIIGLGEGVAERENQHQPEVFCKITLR